MFGDAVDVVMLFNQRWGTQICQTPKYYIIMVHCDVCMFAQPVSVCIFAKGMQSQQQSVQRSLFDTESTSFNIHVSKIVILAI